MVVSILPWHNFHISGETKVTNLTLGSNGFQISFIFMSYVCILVFLSLIILYPYYFITVYFVIFFRHPRLDSKSLQGLAGCPVHKQDVSMISVVPPKGKDKDKRETNTMLGS